MTERQALQALLLPSANNIAAVLARWDAGSADRFVARMNATARSLGMTHTRYTDPSGYDDATVSTAADQVRIVDRAMRLPVFASIVATPSATLPVAGTVHNTNTLLGHDGFVGVKTGSDRRGRRLLRLPGHPLDRRQADDDHRGRAGPARPRPDRGGSRGRRRHGRPHRWNCAPKSSITAAPPAERARHCAARQGRSRPARAPKLHERLHTHRTFDVEQVELNEKAPTSSSHPVRFAG